ncbi:hypothetical protein YTPLAS18_09010 [Nitrospira sp.]|nr:hypothetical protein YTPLAS18_09010 [Nitrospira sp.]
MEKRVENTRRIPIHDGATFMCGVLVTVGLVLGCERLASEPTRAASSRMSSTPWIINPADPGPNVPTVGRSLFDHIVVAQTGGPPGYDVPFPLSALIEKIERVGGLTESRTGLKRLLIPVNRSLQRRAAAGDWFAYPRAVVAVDGEPSAEAGITGPNLKDRLFLGYHEKANVLEVISYNEAAGRFEFQVVRDYRAGGQPTVRYANRALCTACHQNQSPIFSRPLWEETNANVKVAAMLAGERRDFYGFPTHVGVGVPQAFDEATDRANLLSVAQWLWREGCEGPLELTDAIGCRADLARLMLSYELAGRRLFAKGMPRQARQVGSRLAKDWRARWPTGVALPNPDIPNRDPFTVVPVSSFPGLSPVYTGVLRGREERSSGYGRYEPTMLREPLEWWSPPETAGEVEWAVAGLSQFLTLNDVTRLDALLAKTAQEQRLPLREYEAPCQIDGAIRPGDNQLRVQCRAGNGTKSSSGREDLMDDQEVIELEAMVRIRDGHVTDGEVEELRIRARGLDEHLTKLRVVSGLPTTISSTSSLRLELAIQSDRVPGGRQHARVGTGDAIKELRLEWSRHNDARQGRPGRLLIAIRTDGTLLDSALARMVEATRQGTSAVFANAPFRRVSFLNALDAALHADTVRRCCLDDRHLPPPMDDVDGSAHKMDTDTTMAFTEGPIGLFHRYCAACHHGEDAFPPNFLHGSAGSVEQNLRHCAERIAVRLAMWGVGASYRQEAPMPPATELLRHRVDLGTWTEQNDYRLLVQYAQQWISKPPESGRKLDELLHRDYDALPACMPERATNTRVAAGAASD